MKVNQKPRLRKTRPVTIKQIAAAMLTPGSTRPVIAPPVKEDQQGEPFVFAIFDDKRRLVKLCGTVEVLNDFIVCNGWFLTAEVGSKHMYHFAGGRDCGYIECWGIDI